MRTPTCHNGKIPLRGVAAFLAAALAILCAAAAPAAASVSVELGVDRSEVYLGESANLTVTVSGTMDAGEPSLENMGDFIVRGGGASSRISIVNGSFSKSKSYSYEIVPRRTGIFTLGPATVTAAGNTYRSNSLSLTVSKAPSGETDGSGPVFATATLEMETAYPGQEILYKLSVYHSAQLADRVTLTLPDVPGLTFTPLGEPANHTAMIRGVRYGLIEASYAVSAQEPGTYEIAPARMDVPIVVSDRRGGGGPGFPDVDFFGFSWRQKRNVPVYTKEFTLKVEPFPDHGRPADFGGLVGRFSLTAQVSPARIKANESATLTVKVSGQGNVRAIPDLAMPRQDLLKVYPDKPLFEEQPGPAGTSGAKTMKWALVPQAAGTIEIPAFSLSFFDPIAKTYKETSTPVLSLAVDPDGRPESATPAPPAVPGAAAAKKQVEVLGQDIQTIHESLSGLAEASPGGPDPVLIVLLVLPAAIWLSCLLARRLSRKSEKLARAMGARKSFAALEKTMRALPGNDAEGLWKACCAYVSARLLLPGSGLTPAEAARKLQEAGASAEDAEKFGAILARLEGSVFTSRTGLSVEKDKEEIAAVIKSMEKNLP
ncbi:MAG: BatD family protein [Thermodesulfobacteriota bacterium]